MSNDKEKRKEADEARERSLLKTLDDMLCRKVLRRSHNEADRDYSGGGYFFEKSEALFLYSNGFFLREVKTFASVSSGGLSMPSESTKRSDERNGWGLKMIEGAPALVVYASDDTLVTYWHIEVGGSNIIYLDGKAWELCDIPSNHHSKYW